MSMRSGPHLDHLDHLDSAKRSMLPRKFCSPAAKRRYQLWVYAAAVFLIIVVWLYSMFRGPLRGVVAWRKRVFPHAPTIAPPLAGDVLTDAACWIEVAALLEPEKSA